MPDDALTERLLTLLDGEGARVPFADATEGVPAALRGKRPEALPYSPWELLEHLRLAQRDLLEYCQGDHYEQPDWPDEYWPPTPAPPATEAWEQSRRQFEEDRERFRQLVRETADLNARVPHAAAEDDHTYLRQVLLLADHTSYHVGQLVVVRRLLGCWTNPS